MPENLGSGLGTLDLPDIKSLPSREAGKPKASSGGCKALLASSSASDDREDASATKPAKNAATATGKATEKADQGYEGGCQGGQADED